ncbi:MAG: hypothetical protein OXF23_06045, partial [Candidatus Dadabacteria bacterium]|nr:hypothetical protein [Candidatus Dadabacteria bacterium]
TGECGRSGWAPPEARGSLPHPRRTVSRPAGTSRREGSTRPDARAPVDKLWKTESRGEKNRKKDQIPA